MCIKIKSSALVLAEKVADEKGKEKLHNIISESSPQPQATFIGRVDKVGSDEVGLEKLWVRGQYMLAIGGGGKKGGRTRTMEFPPLFISDELTPFADEEGGRPMTNDALGRSLREDEVQGVEGYEPNDALLALLRRYLEDDNRLWTEDAEKDVLEIEELKQQHQWLVRSKQESAAQKIHTQILEKRTRHKVWYCANDGVLVLPFGGQDTLVIPDPLDNKVGQQEALGLYKAFPRVVEVSCRLPMSEDENRAKGAGTTRGAKLQKTSPGGGQGADLGSFEMLQLMRMTDTGDGGKCGCIAFASGVQAAETLWHELETYAAKLDVERAKTGMQGTYADVVEAAKRQLALCKSYMEVMDANGLDPREHLDFIMPEEMMQCLDQKTIDLLFEGSTHTLLVKQMPKSGSGVCALKYLSVCASEDPNELRVQIPSTERDEEHWEGFPTSIEEMDMYCVVLAGTPLYDDVGGEWAAHSEEEKFASAVLVSQAKADQERKTVDKKNGIVGLVVPFVCKQKNSEEDTKQVVETVFPGTLGGDLCVYRQVYVCKTDKKRNERWSNIAGTIPNRNISIHCMRQGVSGVAKGASGEGTSVEQWAVAQVVEFVRGVLLEAGSVSEEDIKEWCASMLEKNFDGRALAVASKRSMRLDFGVYEGYGERIRERVMHTQMQNMQVLTVCVTARRRLRQCMHARARADEVCPQVFDAAAPLARFMCMLSRRDIENWHNGNYVGITLEQKTAESAERLVLAVGGAEAQGSRGGAHSLKQAQDLVLRETVLFTGKDTGSQMYGVQGLRKALGGVPLEDVLLVGACMDDANGVESMQLVVKEHDGKDDEEGVVLANDKMRVGMLCDDDTSFVHAVVSEDQGIRVSIKNISQSLLNVTYEYIDEEGFPDGDVHDMALKTDETFVFQELYYSGSEVSGWKVVLENMSQPMAPKMKFLFLGSASIDAFAASQVYKKKDDDVGGAR